MTNGPDIASIAALIADPARALMLNALMAGRALSAGELAGIAGIAPSTASSHLARLSAGGLVAMRQQGRHRYFEISGSAAVELLESLMRFSTVTLPRLGPRDADLRDARLCYNHLAGRAGVELYDGLIARGALCPGHDGPELTETGRAFVQTLGIDLSAKTFKRPPICRSCLDWSERRSHLGGALGRALWEAIATKGWARQCGDSRVVRFTPEGQRRFAQLLAPKTSTQERNSGQKPHLPA